VFPEKVKRFSSLGNKAAIEAIISHQRDDYAAIRPKKTEKGEERVTV